MATVVITGWVPGFEKVTCTNLVRSELGLGLRDGKNFTDDILKGVVRRIELSTDAEATSFALKLTKIGALARIEPGLR